MYPAFLSMIFSVLFTSPALVSPWAGSSGDDPPKPQKGVNAISTHRFTNRLAEETSPYLLQHAHNPVDWHPWGPEAIALARSQNMPIFLSIGYSTCYWCHVMERECFEEEAIGELMNRTFINIKMDREQRPDVDEIYMTACQVFTRMTTGRSSGGWPLSVFIDPFTLEPYYVGTYFPPKPSHGRPSFPQVLEAMSDAWKNNRSEVEEQAASVARLVRQSLQAGYSVRPLDRRQVDSAVDQLMSMFDRTHAGFGSAPKFPQPVFLELLMQAGAGQPAIDAAVKATLDSMAMGGIYDQVGGGFHRYSVDEQWLVPHFEKMLYDNGQLASVYARSHERTGDPYHARIVEETLDYVLREMTDPETGVFFSAQDAEVNTHEGENYLWDEAELTEVLSEGGLKDDVPLAIQVFGLSEGTNFRDPHHPNSPPRNVLFLADRPEEIARARRMTQEQFEVFLSRVREVLYRSRMTRDQPGLDDKVIASWNGLMIRGMADGGRVLARPDYVAAAERAARSVLSTMRSDEGVLMRTARDGVASIPAFLEDYAFMARAALSLYEATQNPEWLTVAVELVETARGLFWGSDGAWYDTMADQEDLLVRSRNLGDGAVPSGIGTMLLVLDQLHELTQEGWYLDDLESALIRLSGSFAANPVGSAYATMVVDRGLQNYADRLPRSESVALDPPVSATLLPEHVSFSSDATATVVLRLEIDAGYHINAHEPGQDELLGLLVQVRGGEGLEGTVEFPPGELYRESIRVHARELELPIVLKQVGPITGTPSVAVRWQACTDEVCLPPESVLLPLQIDEVTP